MLWGNENVSGCRGTSKVGRVKGRAGMSGERLYGQVWAAEGGMVWLRATRRGASKSCVGAGGLVENGLQAVGGSCPFYFPRHRFPPLSCTRADGRPQHHGEAAARAAAVRGAAAAGARTRGIAHAGGAAAPSRWVIVTQVALSRCPWTVPHCS